jgi:hypothetical protein
VCVCVYVWVCACVCTCIVAGCAHACVCEQRVIEEESNGLLRYCVCVRVADDDVCACVRMCEAMCACGVRVCVRGIA